MKLVIEREGGFDIIESADVERIEVRSDGVEVHMADGTKVTADRESHAESVATATAIASKCGAMVEPLADAPNLASEWVEGEPPRDGRWYVCNYGHELLGVVRWVRGWGDAGGNGWGGGWVDGNGDGVITPRAHLPTPIPPFLGAGAEIGK